MTEIREAFEAFFTDYLVERDLEKTMTHVSENIVSIGTGACEIARNKKELRELMKMEFQEVPNSLQFEDREYRELRLAENAYHIFANMHVTMDCGEEIPFEMSSRLTAVCVWEEGSWKFTSFHMSVPTEEKEGEDFFPLRYGSAVEEKLSATGTKELASIMTSMVPGGIMAGYLEEGFPLYFVNDKMVEMLGYKSYEDFIDSTKELMINTIYEGDRETIREIVEYGLMQHNEYVVQYRAVKADGSLMWVEDIGRGIDVNGRRAMVSILHDISERVDEEERLKEEAKNDPLTGLFNRKYISQYIEKCLQQNKSIQLFMMDIDNFKQINDTRGHVEGDKVLKYLADIMNGNQSDSECYARLGGDEFMVCFIQEENENYAVEKIRGIQKQFEEKMHTDYPELNISISTGGLSNLEGADLKELYNLADVEMYRVKKSEKGQLRFNGKLALQES